MKANGSLTEKSDPLLKFRNHLSSPSFNALSTSCTEQLSLAHFAANKGSTLERASVIDVKLPLPNTITKFMSTRAVSRKNLRKDSSARSPRKLRKIISLMCDWTHSMAPASCQNLKLSLPVGSSVLLDCKLVQTAQTSALDR